MIKYCTFKNYRLIILTLTFTAIATHAKDYNITEIATNLKHPWSIGFLPDKELLVTERQGSLRLIRNDKLVEEEITGLPEIFTQGQGGLLDVLVDPDYKINQLLYLSFSTGNRSSNALRVISARLVDMSLRDIKVLLTVSPTKDTPQHFGGRMTMLADNTILITSGDGFDFREQAQSLNSMLGKVLRINTDGSVPDNNPFVAQQNIKSEIYSYGHRNPQAILVDRSGKIWAHEHGPKGGDELNIIKPGINYGWPAITYGMDYSGAIISPFSSADGMQQPVTYWVPSIAPAGMTQYLGTEFPQWHGNLFIAALAEKSVRRLTIRGDSVISQELILTELKQRIRDIRTSPDGYLYVLTDSTQGSVLKLSAKK